MEGEYKMELNSNANNKPKNITTSIYTGIAIGFVTFIVSTLIFLILGWMLIVLAGIGGDAAIMWILFVWPPVLGVLISVFVGVRSGLRKYKNIKSGTLSTSMSAVTLFILWVLTNVFANVGWSMLYLLFNPTYNENLFNSANILSSLFSGMIAGLLQWLLLIRIIPNVGRGRLAIWIPISIFGWVFAPIVNNLWTAREGMFILVSAISALTIAVLQWLILRKYSKLAFWWFPAQIIDFAAVSLLSRSNIILNIFVTNFLFGMVGSIASGIAIVFILKKPLDVSRLETENIAEPS